MNKFKIAIFTILIIIFSLIGIKKLIYINQVKDLKNKEDSFLNESIRVLNECFDIENKDKRTLNKSIELIEYCLEEYGYKNWFNSNIYRYFPAKHYGNQGKSKGFDLKGIYLKYGKLMT